MIKLNREALVNFLQVLLEGKQNSNDCSISGKFPINERQSFIEEQVSDKEIEENFKFILSE